MNRVAKVAGWSVLGLVGAALLVEVATGWIVVQVVRAIEEYEA